MRDLILTNKIIKSLNDARFYKSKIFVPKKIKLFDDHAIESYEIEKDGGNKITLTHHKKAQAIATVFDIGLMICVDVDHNPYYYFY